MAVPFEILLAAAEVYWAPYGTAYPIINVAPAAAWTLIGTAGSLNRTEDGVTITSSQELFDVRVDGSPYPIKEARLSEELLIAFTMLDMTLEHVRLAFNNNAVTTLVGPPATKHMQLERGSLVTNFALLMRHPSPYNDVLKMQWELHKVSHRGTSEVNFRRTAPAGVRMEFTALADSTKPAGELVGRAIAQTA